MIDGWIEHIPLNNPDDEKILPDFKTKFKSIYMDCDHEELSNRRGMILELLVNSFVAARYRSYPTYSRGCIVQLNSKQLIRERKTVDIAGWNGKIVELYETKVGPDLFGFEVLDLLCYIKKNLDCAKVCSIVGCITMANRSRLKDQITLIQEERHLDCSLLALFGKDELLSLKEQPIIA